MLPTAELYHLDIYLVQVPLYSIQLKCCTAWVSQTAQVSLQAIIGAIIF